MNGGIWEGPEENRTEGGGGVETSGCLTPGMASWAQQRALVSFLHPPTMRSPCHAQLQWTRAQTFSLPSHL